MKSAPKAKRGTTPDGTFPRPSWVLSPVFSKLEGLEKIEREAQTQHRQVCHRKRAPFLPGSRRPPRGGH